jgi:multidrug resistance efflux pump
MRVVAGVVGLLALGAGAWFGQSWWTTGRFMVSTDDAYVGARSSTLSPKVSGYIADVAVEDNAQVKAGDVLVRIDDGDYRLAVQTARDQVAVQQASIERLGKQAHATTPGRDLIAAAQRIFRYRDGWLGRVHIGTTNTTLMYILPPILRDNAEFAAANGFILLDMQQVRIPGVERSGFRGAASGRHVPRVVHR